MKVDPEIAALLPVLTTPGPPWRGTGISTYPTPGHPEGEGYAEALAAQGVPVVYRDYAGAIHGFMTMPSLTLARQAGRQVCGDIRAVLNS